MKASLSLLSAFAFTVNFSAPALAGQGHGHAADHGHEAAKGGKTAWDALGEIQAGNKRFVEGKLAHPEQDVKTREQLAKGQKPHTIVLSCSDSRVPPELVFDQGLGQVFTVRTAGHTLNPATIASIEYALEHLGSRLVVVMGHESCGAVKAALDTPPGKSAGSPDLDQLVGAIRPAIAGRKPAASDKTLREPVKANVSSVATDLVKKSRIIREAVESGDVMVAQGIYSLQTGKVEFWDVGELGSGKKRASAPAGQGHAPAEAAAHPSKH